MRKSCLNCTVPIMQVPTVKKVKKDLHDTPNGDIILKAVDPEPVNSRGYLGLNKKDFAVVSRVVVVYRFFSVLARGKAGGNFFFYKFLS